MPSIRLREVSRTYKERTLGIPALREISLEIGEGEFVVVAGPSGSGKTTLMNIMGTLDSPDSGEVYLGGRELSGLSSHALAEVRLREIGFVFQSLNLIDVLTARENVEYVMLLQVIKAAERRARSEAMLESVGLADLADRRAYLMSGGEKQRVAVARAVAAKPRLILADEPTASLDSENSGHLLDLMAYFNQSEGMTFVIATHDPMIMDRARRIVRLKDGKILHDETR